MTDATAGQTPAKPVHIDNTDEFADRVQDGVVLVDFYADWCGPCKMLEPTIEALAESTDATVLKVDVDHLEQLASEYNVRGVPTLVVFSEGELEEQVVGVRSEDELRDLIESYTAA